MAALSTWRNVYMRGVTVIQIYKHLYKYRPNDVCRVFYAHISKKYSLSLSLTFLSEFVS